MTPGGARIPHGAARHPFTRASSRNRSHSCRANLPLHAPCKTPSRTVPSGSSLISIDSSTTPFKFVLLSLYTLQGCFEERACTVHPAFAAVTVRDFAQSFGAAPGLALA